MRPSLLIVLILPIGCARAPDPIGQTQAALSSSGFELACNLASSDAGEKDLVQFTVWGDEQGVLGAYSAYFSHADGTSDTRYTEDFDVSGDAGSYTAQATVYPNPAIDSFSLTYNPKKQSPFDATLEVSDAKGTQDFQLTCSFIEMPNGFSSCKLTTVAPRDDAGVFVVPPKGSGDCDQNPRDDSDNLSDAIGDADAGDVIELSAGRYCVKSPIFIPPSASGVTIQGAGMSDPNDAGPSTIVAVPYSELQAEVNAFQENGCDAGCAFFANYVFQGGTPNTFNVTIRDLTVYGNSDKFLPPEGSNCDHLKFAGGIHPGRGWQLQSIHIDSTLHWGFMVDYSDVHIHDSMSSGPTCDDGIGGGYSPGGGGGDPDAGITPVCRGVRVLHHHWTSDFQSRSSVFDITNQAGMTVLNSLNESANDVFFEGSLNSRVIGNQFTGPGGIVIRSDQQYRLNDEQKGKLIAVTEPREIVVASNAMAGGYVQVGFIPKGLPVAPQLGGDVLVAGNSVVDTSQNQSGTSPRSGVMWCAENSLDSVGNGWLLDNGIANYTSNVQPQQGDDCYNNNTGVNVTDYVPKNPPKGFAVLHPSIDRNSLKTSDGQTQLQCGVQGTSTNFDSQQVTQVKNSNTFQNVGEAFCVLP